MARSTGTTTTTSADMINPQVMADMISAKVDTKVVVTPFAKLDTTLQGRAGDTITVPAFKYIGEAEDVAEGVEAGLTTLEADSVTFQIKKAMKAIELTDEAVLSGYGNPIGEATSQLAKSIAQKLDIDAMNELQGAEMVYSGSSSDIISYSGIINAIDLFEEEVQSDKVMFINPHQVTQLRADADFISADKYDNAVMMRGEIGMIAGTRIVASKNVAEDSGVYSCPIVKLTADSETEDESPAITIFLKRETNVETERKTLSRKTLITVDKMYGVAITDQSKVVVAQFASSASV